MRWLSGSPFVFFPALALVCSGSLAVPGSAGVSCQDGKGGLYLGPASQASQSRPSASRPAPAPDGWTTAVEPKPLSNAVKKGLDWLVQNQHPSGGWAQGDESAQMGAGHAQLKDKPNVADTCTAALALLRSGSTPNQGPYAEQLRKAIAFVCSEVEAADEKSLLVTSVQGTRIQMKLGPFIDTFLASMLFAEVKGKMPAPADEKRLVAALDKVLDKIEKNQNKDGTWDSRGWAPVLSQAMAGKGINRARQAGAQVSADVLQRAFDYSKLQFDGASKPSASSPGAAGVALYASAGNLGVLRDSANTDAASRPALQKIATESKDAGEREQAIQKLAVIEEKEKHRKDAESDVVGQLADPKFVAGFGSNGGEEFLSYMNIAESLVLKGGAEWQKWDSSMTGNLGRIQNQDGSWTGHHCITGRTFCTATALLVLMADRTPVPAAAKVSGK